MGCYRGYTGGQRPTLQEIKNPVIDNCHLRCNMAARKDLHHTKQVRKKIQTSQLVNRLQANALGELDPEMSVGQIRSAETLLRKSVPDLSATDITTGGEQVKVELGSFIPPPDED